VSEKTEVIFIPLDLIIKFHYHQLELFGGMDGGMDGVRDMHLLESAIAQAESTYYYGSQSLYEAAAAYLYHIAENQPFIDGNKRSAVDTALTFLEVNGVIYDYEEMYPYEICIAVAEKRLDKAGVAKALEEGSF